MEHQNFSPAQMETALRTVLTAPGLTHPRYAVAVPVVFGPPGAELLIEVRAAGISQAGDPCFPGGKIEPDETPAEAAARELAEELGLHMNPSNFLGRLPTVHTPLGSKTDFFVCTVPLEEAAAACPAPSEVSTLLRVPLTFFLSRPGAASYRVEGHTIWGMTAGAISHFCAAWNRAAALLP